MVMCHIGENIIECYILCLLVGLSTEQDLIFHIHSRIIQVLSPNYSFYEKMDYEPETKASALLLKNHKMPHNIRCELFNTVLKHL